MIKLRKRIFLFVFFISMFFMTQHDIFGGDLYDSEKIIKILSLRIEEELTENITNLLQDKNDFVYSKEIYNKYFERVDEKDYNFYKNLIPEEYLTIFLLYTKDDPEFRLMIYSIMKHESIDFLEYINKNSNHSIDYGPMMLNSRNLNNEKFMNLYAPNKQIFIDMGYNLSNQIDLYNYYIAICINLFKDHLNRYEKYNDKTTFMALQAYNGGEGVHSKYASWGKKYRTAKYAEKILSIYSEIKEKYEKI